LLAASHAIAHDIPNDVIIQAYFKPEGQRLRMIVRAPLNAMRDVVFPQREQGYLDLPKVTPFLRDAAKIWITDALEVREGGARLPKFTIVAARASLESDKSYTSYEQALANVTGPPLPPETNVVWNQAMLDVLLETPIESDRSEFSIHPALERLGLRVVTVLRFLPPGGTLRAFEYTGDPGMVRLDPRWHQAAGRFVVEGFWHILDGTDHLLFLLCLVIPFRRFGALIPIVTAFTLAHSITLIGSALGFAPDALWFSPLIETLIAASIVYMAIENITGAGTVHRRWMIAFAFGLVHGFGFSFALRETLQFAGSHLLTSLVAFNVGIEIGQLAVLVLFIPVLEWLFRYAVAERLGTIIVSAFVAHTGWHWMTERGAQLRQFPLRWPEMTPAAIAVALRWLMVAVALAGLMWLVSTILRSREARRTENKPSPS
jgi:hypothetical protein